MTPPTRIPDDAPIVTTIGGLRELMNEWILEFTFTKPVTFQSLVNINCDTAPSDFYHWLATRAGDERVRRIHRWSYFTDEASDVIDLPSAPGSGRMGSGVAEKPA